MALAIAIAVGGHGRIEIDIVIGQFLFYLREAFRGLNGTDTRSNPREDELVLDISIGFIMLAL